MYSAAVRVLHEEGGRLNPMQVRGRGGGGRAWSECAPESERARDAEESGTSSPSPPLQVLAALPDDMSLADASATLGATLSGAMHMRRQMQVCVLGWRGGRIRSPVPHT